MLRKIYLIEGVTIPVLWYGRIIFYGSFANGIKVFLVIIVIIASLFTMRFIRYIFRGAKRREIKNKPMNGMMKNKKRYGGIEKVEDSVDEEEFVSDEYILEKYPEFKELILSQNSNEIVKEIKAIDSNFNNDFFTIKAYEFSKELIKTRIVKKTSAEYVYKAFNTGIINVKLPYFYSFEKIADYYVMKLRVEESIKNESYRYGRSGISNIIIYTYELTFVKSIKDGVKSRKCPRCGASLKENSVGICSYCFKYNDKEDKDKIKSNVSKFSYDIPIIKFPKVIPKVCVNCGAPLRKELKGFCEYCKSDNNPSDNEWVLVEFEKLENGD